MPLTVEQARLMIPCKKDFYDAMRRNHYVMPEYKERIVTTAWMLGVVRGTHWCLSSAEVNCLPQCARRPTKKMLAVMLVAVMRNVTEPKEKVEAIKATAELVLAHPPDMHWMLTCLAQIDANHEVFGRDYVPPKPVKEFEAEIDEPNLDALQGFFAGLPLSANQHGRHTVNFQDPSVIDKRRLAKFEAKIKRAQKRLDEEKKRQEERAAELAANRANSNAASSSRANPLESSRRDSNVAAA